MTAMLPLRDGFTASKLRLLVRRSRDDTRVRRLLTLAMIYDLGGAVRLGSVGLQIVRDWVLRLSAGGPAGLPDDKAHGPSRWLGEARRKALIAMVEAGPDRAVHGLMRWRLPDLAPWLCEEFRLSIGVETAGRELCRHSFRKLSAGPGTTPQARRARRRSKIFLAALVEVAQGRFSASE